MSLLSRPGPVAPSPDVRPTLSARLERALPGFEPCGSARFVVLTDLPASQRAAILATLEATADAVLAFAGELDLPLRPLERPLVGVVFGDPAEFERFAVETDRIDARGLAGYWAPGSERIVALVGPPPASGLRRGEIRRSSVLASVATNDRATIAHEAAHQVLHRLGVQRRSPNHPLWISEGLAISFEGVSTGQTAFSDDPKRSARVRAILDRRSARPLASVVSVPRLPDRQRGEVEDFYAQSWSVVRYLRGTAPDRLAWYLRALAGDSGRLSPRRSIEIFELAFGPIPEVERAWRDWASR